MLMKIVVLFCLAVGSAVFAELPTGYSLLPAAEKRSVLLNLVNAKPYQGPLPTENPGVVAMAHVLNPVSLVKTLTVESDEAGNPGRQKLIRTYGTVAPVRLNIFPNSIYSGIFKANSSSLALIRLSLGKQDPDAFIPGIALKVLIDGKNSQNINAAFSADGQGTNRNFFQNNQYNILPAAQSLAQKLLAKAFTLALYLLPGGAESRPEAQNNMPLYEQASVENDGAAAERVIAPYRVCFVPNPALGYEVDSAVDFRVKAAEISSGTLLYTVKLMREKDGLEFVVGEVLTEGAFLASEYGDQQLHFTHHRMPWKF